MKTAILFPGQGSQVVGMGKDLNDNFFQAKHVFEEVNEALKIDLNKIMFEGPIEELTQTQNAQPALMAVSIAIIKVLEEDLGKKFSDLCSITAGHSLGEYSALCAAGSFTLNQTTKLLKVRGNAMASCAAKSDGIMAAILGLDTDTVKELAKKASEGEVCQVANDNSTGQVVISGDRPAVTRATQIAKEYGAKRAIILPVSGAFHSPLMIEAQEEMAELLSDTGIKDPSVPLVANVTADIVTDSSKIHDLLIRQVTGSVRWRESLLNMQAQGVERIIEVGSGKVLCGLAAKTCPNIKTLSIQNSEDIKNFTAAM